MLLRKPVLVTAGAAGAAAAVGWSLWLSTQRFRAENPSYAVVSEENGFEVRTYQPSVVALTHVDGPYDEAVTTAFTRLAAFLSGRNERAEQIKMTAPVFHEKTDRGWAVTFLMPRQWTVGELPRPLDPRIELRPLGIRTVAAQRFSGRPSEARFEDRKRSLLQSIARSAWRITGGEPVLALYEGPLALPFLRRNEVHLAVAR